MLDDFMQRVDDIEEAVDRFILTSETFYDESLHNFILGNISKLVKDIKDSDMDQEQEHVVMEMLVAILEFAATDIKVFLK